MKKYLSLFLTLYIFISCSNNKDIPGIYYVNDDITDKVYIERIKDDYYKVSTPNEWTEYAVIKEGKIEGTWSYEPDKGGLTGIHQGTYTGEMVFHIDLFIDNKYSGNVVWKKLNNKRLKSAGGDKIIYLTFDDGPYDGTPNILLALEKTNVDATFFLIGKHAKELKNKHKNTLQLLKKNSKALLANHSYSHANDEYKYFYSHPNIVMADLIKNKNEILQYTSFWDKLFKSNINGDIVRLPGRNAWIVDDFTYYDLKDVKNLSNSLKSAGFSIYGWDIEWKNVDNYKKIIKRIENKFNKHTTKFPNRCVVLMHDKMFYLNKNRKILIKFINLLKSKGYKFKNLEDF